VAFVVGGKIHVLTEVEKGEKRLKLLVLGSWDGMSSLLDKHAPSVVTVTGHFAYWSFRLRDILPTGQFAYRLPILSTKLPE